MGSSVILPSPGQPAKGPSPTFKSSSIPNIVTFGFEKVSPPSTLYIQRDDVLSIGASSSLAGEAVTIGLRILLPVAPRAGQPDAIPEPYTLESGPGGNNIVFGIFRLPLTALRTTQSITIQLMEGYLLGIVAVAGISQFRGQTFVNCLMRRGTAGQNPPETFMFADYVGGNSAAQYPNGRALHCTEGPGWSHSIQQANPGAGADWTLTMAAGQRALPKSFTAQLLTSGVAGNRNIELIIDDGANVVWRASAPASVIAGTTQQLSGATTNSPTGVVTTDFSVVIPPNLFLEPGWRVRTATTGILAGDQWSNIWFGVEEWIESF